MKFGAFRRLFTEDYKGAPQEQWFSNFISNLNGFFDQAATALRNGLRFSENSQGFEKTIDFTSDAEEQIAVERAVNAVLPLQGEDGAMYTGFAWRPIKPGIIGITVKHNKSVKTSFKIRVEY